MGDISDNTVERRTMLKITGAAGIGINTVGTVPVRAQESRDSVRLVHIGFEHEASLTNAESWSIARTANDDIPKYFIDDGTLYIMQNRIDGDVSFPGKYAVTTQSSLSNVFGPVDTPIKAHHDSHIMPTQTLDTLQSTGEIRYKNKFKTSKAVVTPYKNEKVKVGYKGDKMIVGAGEKKRMRLDPVERKVKAYPPGGSATDVKPKDAEVIPIVIAHNRGKLDIQNITA